MTPIDDDFKTSIKKKLEKSVNKTLPVSPASDPFDDMSEEDISKLYEEVDEFMKEKAVEETQVFDDKDVEITKPTSKEQKTKESFEKKEETQPHEKEEQYPLMKEPIGKSLQGLPSETMVREMIKRYKFVKAELVDKSDFVPIKGKQYLKKSGYRKFVNAFGISVEQIEMSVYELYNDKHAEVRLKVSVPSGQTVEGIGICSWSELHTKTLHNLKATAWTRAFNRGIADLVAYGEVSAEEVMDVSKLEEDF